MQLPPIAGELVTVQNIIIKLIYLLLLLLLLLLLHPSHLESVGLQLPARYIRDFALLNVRSSSKYCPSARCTSAANVVCREADEFGSKTVSLNHILEWYGLKYSFF
jgi:hypothetical protein